MTGLPPLSRPTTTMRHCPRRQPWTLRPSQTRGPDADQNRHGRLWTRKDRRSALVAQGIEHRFPKPCVAGSNPAGGTTIEQGKCVTEHDTWGAHDTGHDASLAMLAS